MEKGTRIIGEGQVRILEFISDRLSYIMLGGRWCDIIVLNVHALCEDTNNDVKDCFYEELWCVFDQFSRYDMTVLGRNFNAEVGREDIFKPTIENERSHEISNDNGVRVADSATSKNSVVKSTMSLIAIFINTPGPLLRERRTT
jgi:hypothetical protein